MVQVPRKTKWQIENDATVLFQSLLVTVALLQSKVFVDFLPNFLASVITR